MADIIEASVLTTNIVNFVSLCERLIRINLIDFLNSHYFNIVHRYILKYMGMLDITVGDRQLAYWILSRNKEETYMACKVALDIINEIYEDNKNLSIDEHFEVCIT